MASNPDEVDDTSGHQPSEKSPRSHEKVDLMNEDVKAEGESVEVRDSDIIQRHNSDMQRIKSGQETEIEQTLNVWDQQSADEGSRTSFTQSTRQDFVTGIQMKYVNDIETSHATATGFTSNNTCTQGMGISAVPDDMAITGSNEMVFLESSQAEIERDDANITSRVCDDESMNAPLISALDQTSEVKSPVISGDQWRSEGLPAFSGGHGAPVQSHIIATTESLLVHLEGQAGEASLCTVYIDRSEETPLPNYGGYRDVRNGVRYLNAIAQTQWEQRKKQKEILITRENLKPEQKKIYQQTEREAWTQMDRPGAVLENRGDYELYPGPYFTSDDWDMVRIQAAIIIQKYVRGSIARRTARRTRAYAKERKKFWEEQERIRKQEADEHLKYEVQRRMEPRSADDFEILYTELATWCAQELNKINASGVVGKERRKAIKALLLKEIKLLQTIDKLRCKAARQNKKERISKTLASMCVPQIWELTNGTIVHVKTLRTTRATDLMHLYHALAKPIGKTDERMGVLGYVKWTVQEFSTALTREILELIEREGDLMNRGRPTSSLQGLRLRILNLFLQFIETPEFNPEAIMHQYVPVDFDFGEKSTPTRKRGTR